MVALFDSIYRFISFNSKIILISYFILTLMLLSSICIVKSNPVKSRYAKFAVKHKHLLRYKVAFLLFLLVLTALCIIPELSDEPPIYRTGDRITIHTADLTVVSYDYTRVKDFNISNNVLSAYEAFGYIVPSRHYCYYGYPYSTKYREYTVYLSFYNGSSVKFNVYTSYKEALEIALYRPSGLIEYTKRSEPSMLVKFITNEKYETVIEVLGYSIVMLTFVYSLLEYIISCIITRDRDDFS